METDYRSDITAGILAGGEARRMGGEDKGLLDLLGKPLIQHCIDRLQPQVGRIIINTSQNAESYSSFGYPLVADTHTGHQGPLAGIAACMDASPAAFLVCVPCDSPVFPNDLVYRLYARILDQDADISIARDGNRSQPLFVLLKTGLKDSLHSFLDDGGRKPDAWYENHKLVETDFSAQGHLFININTRADLARAVNLLMQDHDNYSIT